MEDNYSECDIVFDLMPLYLDKKVGMDSEQFIKKHLDTCETCREMYKDVESAQECLKENAAQEERRQKEDSGKIFLKLQRRFFLALAVYIIVIVGIGACLAWTIIY